MKTWIAEMKNLPACIKKFPCFVGKHQKDKNMDSGKSRIFLVDLCAINSLIISFLAYIASGFSLGNFSLAVFHRRALCKTNHE